MAFPKLVALCLLMVVLCSMSSAHMEDRMLLRYRRGLVKDQAGNSKSLTAPEVVETISRIMGITTPVGFSSSNLASGDIFSRPTGLLIIDLSDISENKLEYMPFLRSLIAGSSKGNAAGELESEANAAVNKVSSWKVSGGGGGLLGPMVARNMVTALRSSFGAEPLVTCAAYSFNPAPFCSAEPANDDNTLLFSWNIMPDLLLETVDQSLLPSSLLFAAGRKGSPATPEEQQKHSFAMETELLEDAPRLISQLEDGSHSLLQRVEDGKPDLYYFAAHNSIQSSQSQLMEADGDHAALSDEEKKWKRLDEACENAMERLSNLYSHQMLSAVFLSSSPVSPMNMAAASRQLQQAQAEGEGSSAGNATESEGPSIEDVASYQIVLWTTIVIALALLATVYSIMNMDVGRDSILYANFKTDMTHWKME